MSEDKRKEIYYPINEDVAKRTKEMNSFSDYRPGSATEEYRRCVDEAAALAERQKARVDPMYHERIDRLLDTYARKLAANMNESNAIDARVPSILITGGSNFPVRKKEKQNAAATAIWRSGVTSRGCWTRYEVPAWAVSAPIILGPLQSGRASWRAWKVPRGR